MSSHPTRRPPQVDEFVALVRATVTPVLEGYALHLDGVDVDPATVDVRFTGGAGPGVRVSLDRLDGTVHAEVTGAHRDLDLAGLLRTLGHDADASRLDARCGSSCELGVRVAETARALAAHAGEALQR